LARLPSSTQCELESHTAQGRGGGHGVRHHVEFSGAEMTFVSAGRWASSAVWSHPAQFKGVATAGLASWLPVGVRWRRGFGWRRRAGFGHFKSVGPVDDCGLDNMSPGQLWDVTNIPGRCCYEGGGI